MTLEHRLCDPLRQAPQADDVTISIRLLKTTSVDLPVLHTPFVPLSRGDFPDLIPLSRGVFAKGERGV